MGGMGPASEGNEWQGVGLTPRSTARTPAPFTEGWAGWQLFSDIWTAAVGWGLHPPSLQPSPASAVCKHWILPSKPFLLKIPGMVSCRSPDSGNSS